MSNSANSRSGAWIFTLIFAALIACDESGDGGTSVEPSGCTSIPKVQALSQPCCPSWGIDACGALLFCAAFDGRSVATCYPERSQANGDECTEDRQCQSASCDATRSECMPTLGQPCTRDVGCARADESGHRLFCGGDVGHPLLCNVAGTLSYGATCANDQACASGDCDVYATCR